VNVTDTEELRERERDGDQLELALEVCVSEGVSLRVRVQDSVSIPDLERLEVGEGVPDPERDMVRHEGDRETVNELLVVGVGDREAVDQVPVIVVEGEREVLNVSELEVERVWVSDGDHDGLSAAVIV